MPSPFPGMDPYLEQHWQDVHARLILYACDQLEDQLPGNLIARVEEWVVFETEEEEQRSVYPDVKIVEPVIVEFHGEPATETYIHILERGAERRLVTVIEILSLANKLPGEGQRQYRKKQAELHKAGVSLVEIDLLRSGQRVLGLPGWRIPPHVRDTYLACVRRGWQPGQFEVYPISLRRPLPPLRIPLRPQDDDIRLDLQAILELAYRKGRYHLTLDYGAPPDPPLASSDAKWARALVKKARKR